MATATTTLQEVQAASSGHEQKSWSLPLSPPVQTSVNYWKSDRDRMPAVDTSLPFVDRKMTFFQDMIKYADPCAVTIEDIRGHEEEFTLDKQGFQLCRQQIKTQNFTSDEQIKASYYAEVEALLKTVTGASKVHIFDHHIRDLSFEASLVAPPLEDSADLPGPVRAVHVDNTPESARQTVRSMFPSDEAEILVNKPFAIINVWRPLKPVRRDPLGVVDARSLKASERVECCVPIPGEDDDFANYHLRASPEHRWYFARNQQPDEFLLFKISDSRAEDSFLGVAHTSFVDPETEHIKEDRASIEARCLCFFDDAGL